MENKNNDARYEEINSGITNKQSTGHNFEKPKNDNDNNKDENNGGRKNEAYKRLVERIVYGLDEITKLEKKKMKEKMKEKRIMFLLMPVITIGLRNRKLLMNLLKL